MERLERSLRMTNRSNVNEISWKCQLVHHFDRKSAWLLPCFTHLSGRPQWWFGTKWYNRRESYMHVYCFAGLPIQNGIIVGSQGFCLPSLTHGFCYEFSRNMVPSIHPKAHWWSEAQRCVTMQCNWSPTFKNRENFVNLFSLNCYGLDFPWFFLLNMFCWKPRFDGGGGNARSICLRFVKRSFAN